MAQTGIEQWTITNAAYDDYFGTWLEAFLVDRKAQNMSPGTVRFYREKLKLFSGYCDGQVINRISEITPDILRRWLLHLQERGHNPGGVHAAFRALRTFLLWYEAENEPEGWKNPIHRVKAPRVPSVIVEPVELATVKALLATCAGNGLTALRDKALLLFLLDTGARAAEVCALNTGDVDLMAGAILIRQGKGRKPRTVFMGQKTRRAIRAYLKARRDDSPALWATDDGGRLTYWGLNLILTRRAKLAGVEKPGLHDFRRAFALNFLRNNPGEIYSLQKLMGHADLQVLRRYLAQTDQDIQSAHRRGSPVDNGGL
jgi:site-specific recombinase XerD